MVSLDSIFALLPLRVVDILSSSLLTCAFIERVSALL